MTKNEHFISHIRSNPTKDYFKIRQSFNITFCHFRGHTLIIIVTLIVKFTNSLSTSHIHQFKVTHSLSQGHTFIKSRSHIHQVKDHTIIRSRLRSHTKQIVQLIIVYERLLFLHWSGFLFLFLCS